MSSLHAHVAEAISTEADANGARRCQILDCTSATSVTSNNHKEPCESRTTHLNLFA